ELAAERVRRDLFRGPEQLANRPGVGRRWPPRRWRLHLGGVVRRTLEQVLLHAEERAGHRQHDDDGDGDPAGGLVSEGLQHVSARGNDVAAQSSAWPWPALRIRRPGPQKKKAPFRAP